KQTGFWFHDDPAWANWQPDAALAAFMHREPRPLVLTFSSQPVEQPVDILAAHARAAQQIGRPLLVIQGWAGFDPDSLPSDVDRDNMHFAAELPHDWVFQRAAAAIQHGGIGSIARALRQGCPLLIEPFGNDQFFNAAQVTRLQVGVAVHPLRLNAEGLGRVLRDKVLQPLVRQRAEVIGARLSGEDGLDEMCEHVERTFFAHSTVQRALRIPHIIHQTWKTREVPQRWQALQQSWQRHQPGWEYRLWTDEELRVFVQQQYAWFLPIYDGYPEPIMRVDAARYLLMHHFGGIYADLDYECVQPFEPLLRGQRLLLGWEPVEHIDIEYAHSAKLRHQLCNAVIASEPGHPFWEHVVRELVKYHQIPGALDATGPNMLARAYDAYPNKNELLIESSELLYPLHSGQRWEELPPAQRAQIAARAYGIHHWHGSWWREETARQQEQLPFVLTQSGKNLGQGKLDLNGYQPRDTPLVSCLMVTHGRPDLALRAVHCFRRQRYANAELVIVDDCPDDALAEAVAAFGEEAGGRRQEAGGQVAPPPGSTHPIVYIRLPHESRSLGELRNLAVARARGSYIAQWDDDDLADPERLATQMAAIEILQADVCFLQRHTLWWPQQQRLALSTRRIWEGSFICKKDVLPAYPALGKGEDTPVMQQLVAQQRCAMIDAPQLYTYVCHGANTHADEHWEAHWRAASASYQGQHTRPWCQDSCAATVCTRMARSMFDRDQRAFAELRCPACGFSSPVAMSCRTWPSSSTTCVGCTTQSSG
ncbi:glycosyltransferase, partial [Candidatus Gracilibacteria bacterium]|nr:glycosyltransferase [Candidatus Gracilibacteria bacterium]